MCYCGVRLFEALRLCCYLAGWLGCRGTVTMRRIALFYVSMIGSSLVFAHHGTAFYYDIDNLATIEGEILAVSWRNPHVMFEIERSFDDGTTEIWEIESSSRNGLQRVGIEADVVAVGDHVRLTGALSRTGLPAMAAFLMTLDDGTEVPIWPQRARQLGREVQRAPVSNAVAEASRREARGIFRVWSRPGMQGQLLALLEGELPYTAAARAAQKAWNPLSDDPVLQCTPRGMPSIMNNPLPIEFIDQNGTILLRLEEWDGVRTIHMTSDASTESRSATRFGYSTGHWEDNTLTVTTTAVSDPYFDDHGTPQGEQASVVERFTLSEDETRLDYEAIHTDPLIFTGPGRLVGYWNWVPGEEVKPFDCAVQ